MYAEERRQEMARRIARDGRASVVDLADSFEVTPETVRRDLDRLEDGGIIRRVHGGAVPADAITVLELDLDERESTRSAQKDRIAARTLDLLPTAGGSIVVDAGTTTGRLVARLALDCELTIVTNSITNAARLTHHTAVHLHMVGGRVRGTTQAAVGPAAVDQLSSMRVDVALLGANGLTERFGASTPDADEAAAKRAMRAAAHQVIVMADATKLGREHLHAFAPPTTIDIIVTDSDANPAQISALEAAGIKVVLA